MEWLNQWHWFGLAMILLVAEILGAAGYLLWTAISSILIGLILIVFPDIEWQTQLVLFSLLTLLVLYVWWRHLQKRIDTSDQPLLNQRGEQFVGRMTELVEPLVHGRGTVKINDSRWQVTGPDLPKGRLVKIVEAVDSLLLRVESVEDSAIDADIKGNQTE